MHMYMYMYMYVYLDLYVYVYVYVYLYLYLDVYGYVSLVLCPDVAWSRAVRGLLSEASCPSERRLTDPSLAERSAAKPCQGSPRHIIFYKTNPKCISRGAAGARICVV